MVVLWLYVSCRIAANRAKAVRKRRCGAHKTLRFVRLLQARRAAVPIGGENPARLSAARPLRPAQTLFRQKTAFLFMDSPPAKVQKNGFRKRTSPARRGRNASVKGLRRPPQDGTARFAAGGAQGPAACLILLTRKVFAGRLILRGPSYDQSKKTPNGRRGGPAGRKAAGKNAQGRSGRPSGTASAGRTRRTAEIAASGGFSPRSRANRTRRRGRASDRKNERFLPPCDLSKKAHSPNPCAGAVLPAFCERRSAKETKPAPAASEAGSAPPNARGAKIRAGGPPDGPGSRTSAVTSGLRAGRLFYSNCKGRFSSLFFSILIMIVPNPPRTARRKRQEGRFFLEDHY